MGVLRSAQNNNTEEWEPDPKLTEIKGGVSIIQEKIIEWCSGKYQELLHQPSQENIQL